MKWAFLLFVLVLVPTLAFAEGIQGTILKVDRQNNRLWIDTPQGEKTLVISSDTLGLEHAIEGAEVKIEYSRKGNTLTASEINPSRLDNRG